MCILLAFKSPSPNYDLIVIANRDEFHSRDAAPINFWNEKPHILGGRDLEAGGSWLAINKNGYLAAITNISGGENAPKLPQSRGSIVTEFLDGKKSSETYAETLRDKHQNYNGFNLILYDGNTLYWDSNRSEKGKALSGKPYAISNTTPNHKWVKTEELKRSFRNALQGSSIGLQKRLLSILGPKTRYEGTSSRLSMENLDTLKKNIFIQGTSYGTRCSSVILFDNRGLISFTERRFNALGKVIGENTMELKRLG